MFFRLLSTALLPFLFVACGKTNKSNNRMKTFDIDSPNAVEASSNWQVQCLDSKNCPNTVGQLLMVSGGKGGACTATLIGPDLALSNSHCFDFLPGRSADSTCTGGRTVMIFASNSPSGREVVECESVIRKSELRKSEGLRSPDYLIIKLKRKLNRGFESINTSGVSDGQALVIKKVNPTRLNLGELEVSRCEVVHGTLFMPGNKSRESAVHVTKGCEVIEGNSGSSLFDAQGKIRGVIYAKLNPDEMDKSGIEGIEDVTSVIRRVKAGYMTNAACMKLSANRTLP
ncbi:MAG: trypsin-like serine protease, partial [Bdellovibrionales bacterium]